LKKGLTKKRERRKKLEVEKRSSPDVSSAPKKKEENRGRGRATGEANLCGGGKLRGEKLRRKGKYRGLEERGWKESDTMVGKASGSTGKRKKKARAEVRGTKGKGRIVGVGGTLLGGNRKG